MHHLLAAIAAAEATPTPVQTVDPELVTPGPWGFAVIALLAVVVMVLVWDMLRRIRRGRVRADIADELAAEKAQQDEEPGDAAAPDSGRPDA